VLTLALARNLGCMVGISRRPQARWLTPLRTTNGSTRCDAARRRRRSWLLLALALQVRGALTSTLVVDARRSSIPTISSHPKSGMRGCTDEVAPTPGTLFEITVSEDRVRLRLRILVLRCTSVGWAPQTPGVVAGQASTRSRYVRARPTSAS